MYPQMMEDNVAKHPRDMGVSLGSTLAGRTISVCSIDAFSIFVTRCERLWIPQNECILDIQGEFRAVLSTVRRFIIPL